MKALKESGESSLHPPCFIVNVVRKPECTKDLNTAMNVSLSEEGKPDKTIQFKLYVSISTWLSKGQDNFLLLVDSDHVYVCEQNKLQLTQKHTTKSHDSDSANIALPDTGKGYIHTNKRSVSIEQTCCGIPPGTDKGNIHTKDENATMHFKKLASLHASKDSGHKMMILSIQKN